MISLVHETIDDVHFVTDDGHYLSLANEADEPLILKHLQENFQVISDVAKVLNMDLRDLLITLSFQD